jgi:thymidine kinase
MFSGKTSELLRLVRKLNQTNKKCIIINYAKDEGYDKKNVVATHDQ